MSLSISPPAFVECGDLRIAVHEFGDPEGVPLLFFHGWPAESTQGFAFDAAAKLHGFRVLAPDRPGVGQSTFQKNRALTDWPVIVEKILDHYAILQCAVVGMSGGGPYAAVTAWGLPKRILAGAVVCGAPPLDAAESVAKLHPAYRALLSLYRRNEKVSQLFFRVLRPVLKIRLPRFAFNFGIRFLPKADRLALQDEHTWEWVYGCFLRAWNGGADGVFHDASLYARPWGFALEEIRVPMHYWHGSLDNNFHWELAKDLAGRIPGAKFHLMPEQGHYSLPRMAANDVLAALQQSLRVT